jgi:hypothetical protein
MDFVNLLMDGSEMNVNVYEFYCIEEANVLLKLGDVK